MNHTLLCESLFGAALVLQLVLSAGQGYSTPLAPEVLGSLLFSAVVIALLVIFGHILPTYLARRLAWGWSLLATTVLFVGGSFVYHAVANGTSPNATYWAGVVAIGMLVIIIPLYLGTALIRGFIPALRPLGARRASGGEPRPYGPLGR